MVHALHHAACRPAQKGLSSSVPNIRQSSEAQASASPSSQLELPRAIALNSFSVLCPGTHRLSRLPRPSSKDERRCLERSIRSAVFLKGSYAYASASVAIENSTVMDVPCDFDRELHLFDLRGCFAAQAQSAGFGARFGFGGLIFITGFAGDIEIDGIVVQRQLRARLVEEGTAASETWLVARHDTHWILAGTLASVELQEHALGESAERLSGDGPRKGEVIGVCDNSVTLRVGNQEISVNPSNYTLTANFGYVRRFYRPDTLSRLQVASQALTASGHRNRYAVKDRYLQLREALDQLGWRIAMPADREAKIEQAWTEIRVQEGVA
jgi:hypothetical protein